MLTDFPSMKYFQQCSGAETSLRTSYQEFKNGEGDLGDQWLSPLPILLFVEWLVQDIPLNPFL
jgi:hypothetical protein